MGLIGRLIAVVFLSIMALTSIVFFALCLSVWLVTVWFDRRLSVLHWCTCVWGSFYVWMFPFWKVEVRHRERFKSDRVYVIVSNHQSQLDILLSFYLFKHFKWVSKSEVFWIPFIGWNMFLNRYIGVRRGRTDSVRRMYKDCLARLAAGSSVYVFPEGTRSEDGEIKPFKTGAFAIAKRAGVGVLPIAIEGTAHALPKKSLNFHGRQALRMTVLPEIDAEAVQAMNLEDLAQQSRLCIASICEGASEVP